MKKIVIPVMMAVLLLLAGSVVFADEPVDDTTGSVVPEAAQGSVIPNDLVGKWSIKSTGRTFTYEFTSDGLMLFYLNGKRPNDEVAYVKADGKVITITQKDGSAGTAEYQISKDVIQFSKLKGPSGLMKGKMKKEM